MRHQVEDDIDAQRVGGLFGEAIEVELVFALAFPAGALMFLYSLIRSTLTTLRAGGVTWRGTFYPLSELRKNITPLS